MADANRTIAGKYVVTVGDQRYECMGELELETGNEERTGDATSGGVAFVTVKAKPYRAKMKFANRVSGDPQVLWSLGDGFNVTFSEITRGIRHLFSNASAVGTPSKNLATGEVGGIEIITDTYQTTGLA